MIKVKKKKDIKEISADDENDFMTRDFGDKGIPKKLTSWLSDHNFTKIGEGQFGYVYGSPDENFVVKVNNGLYDGAYLDFAEWCSKQNNPHLPKIGKIRNFDEKTYFVFIEKLEEANIPVKDISNFAITLKNILKEICKGRTAWSAFIFDNIMPLLSNQDENLAQQILECLVALSKYVKYNSIDIDDEMDLHSGNFMKKGYYLVIADPVC